MYFETSECRQIDTKYIKYTDFEIHFSFFGKGKIKISEKVIGH